MTQTQKFRAVKEDVSLHDLYAAELKALGLGNSFAKGYTIKGKKTRVNRVNLLMKRAASNIYDGVSVAIKLPTIQQTVLNL